MSFENFISEKAIARRENAVVCGREAFSRRKRQEKEKEEEEEEERRRESVVSFSCRRRTDARERGEERRGEERRTCLFVLTLETTHDPDRARC